MARIRTIKPDFWTDAALIECSLNARLLFIGTWNFADDFGNLDRSAKQAKARIFPADTVDCEPMIQELITHGLLIEYSVNDKKYLHIRGFRKHQVINRPGKPQCPIYEDSLSTHGGLPDHSLLKGREGKGVKEAASGHPSDVWTLGVQLLTDSGIKEATARTYLGSLRKSFDDSVITEAIQASVGKTEPKAYIAAILKNAPHKGEDWRKEVV